MLLYPIDIYLVCASLCKPLIPIYHAGMIYASTANGVYFVDLGGGTIINPSEMTVVQLKHAYMKKITAESKKIFKTRNIERASQLD